MCRPRLQQSITEWLDAEDRTRQLLEITIAEYDYRIALSKDNLWASHLWSSVEVEKGTPVPPLDLMLPLLRLRLAIHVVYGGSDLQPLTVEELSLVEGIMNGRLGIP